MDGWMRKKTKRRRREKRILLRCFCHGSSVTVSPLYLSLSLSLELGRKIDSLYSLTMDLTWLSALIVGAALGFCIGTRRSKPPPVEADVDGDTTKLIPKSPLEIEKLADILDDFKMVLVVRNDLKMGKGKIAAQCSHATLGLYKKLVRRAPKALDCWEECAQPKVVVKIETEDEMLELQERAKSLKLPTHITIDAGRTQIAPNSRTVMAILGPVQVVDEVTGGLKLL